MKTIERPGIDIRWLKLWKYNSRVYIKVLEINGPRILKQLEYYAQHGEALQKAEKPYTDPDVTPPYRNWELSLNQSLQTYGLYLGYEWERLGVDGPSFDTAVAVRMFAAIYTSQMMDLQLISKSPMRFPGRTLHWMGFEHLSYTALGVVIGCKEQAFRLAPMQLAGYRKGFYDDDRDHYPGAHFILRILADYLGERPLVLQGFALSHPVYNALMDVWREPDVNTLIPILLAACDEHTQMKRGTGPDRIYIDFSDWTRTPIEILLLFKLRQLLGLSNPQLDHPLMNTPLGVLPEEVAFEPDDLVKQVRARMMQDGYDEDEIFAEICREDLSGVTPATATPTPVRQHKVNPSAPPIPNGPIDLSTLKLREFVNSSFGLVFNAPESWQETTEDLLFGIHDPKDDIQFTASAYAIPVESVEDWADIRFLVVDSQMTYLTQVQYPYELKGAGWTGIAAEYQGKFPNDDYETYYLVLCLKNGDIWISLTLVASTKTFVENEGLYRWLLKNQLTLRTPEKYEKVTL